MANGISSIATQGVPWEDSPVTVEPRMASAWCLAADVISSAAPPSGWSFECVDWKVCERHTTALVVVFLGAKGDRFALLLEPNDASANAYQKTRDFNVGYLLNREDTDCVFDEGLMRHCLAVINDLPALCDAMPSGLVSHNKSRSGRGGVTLEAGTRDGQFESLDLRLAELCIQGFTVLENVITPEVIADALEGFMPLVDNVACRDKEPGRFELGDIRVGKGRRQEHQRLTVHWPWAGKLARTELTENRAVLSLLELYWGSRDFRLACLHSNTPYPGARHQDWHRDLPLVTPGIALQRNPVMIVRIPLVDITIENGAAEVIVGTHHGANPEYENRFNEIVCGGLFPSTHRICVAAGSIYVMDPRLLHRGMPNLSGAPRPDLTVGYAQTWHSRLDDVFIGHGEAQGLSDFGRQLFREAIRVQELDGSSSGGNI